jgi:hypothetical protein
MAGYDFNRPYIDQTGMTAFRAVDPQVASRYGSTIMAAPMSNSEYAQRFDRMGSSNNMNPAPSHGRIFPGYLVVRKLGTADQYETWIPDHAFEEIYASA